MHCYIDNMTKHDKFTFYSVALICSLTYILLRDELRILSKLQAFAGNPFFGVVLYCNLQYITLRNKTLGEYHKQHLLPVFVVLF